MPTYEVTKTIILTKTVEAEDGKAALAWTGDCNDDTIGEDEWDDRHEESEAREVSP